MSDHAVRVRGSDFTGYRIAGAVAALLLLLALAAQMWLVFQGDTITSPETRWSAVSGGEAGGGIVAAEILSQRTTLQEERTVGGPSPEDPSARAKIDTEILLVESPLSDGAGLTQGWATMGPDTGAILHESQRTIGSSSLPYPNADLFERPFARDWRFGLADIATHIGAFAILGFSLLLALMLAVRGRVPITQGKSGRTVKRFGLLERAVHWMTSISFLALALTGIVIGFGDTLIRPFGEGLLGQAGWIATWGHAVFFPSFALGIVVMAIMWTWRNLPSRLDVEWLRRGGGFFSDADHPPARKFNAGQKLIFWSAILGGAAMVATGITLMFPFYFLGLGGMSWAMLAHAIIAMLLITVFIGHIYIGTVGMQGAFWAMWGGDVDRNWAEEHHDLWLSEIDGKEKTT